MIPLECSFKENSSLYIWKGEAEPIVICINDILKFMKGLNKILFKDRDTFTMRRQIHGLLTIKRTADTFYIYGNRGYYTCDMCDIKHLWDYIIKSIEANKNLYLDKVPPFHPLRNSINKFLNIFGGRYIEKARSFNNRP